MFGKHVKIVVALGFIPIFMILGRQLTKADNFYPSGDINNCKFASTVGIGYESLPNNITYSPTDLVGVQSQWLNNHAMKDVADVSYPNAHRFSGVADTVAVPPNTKLDVSLFAWNYTGHEVNTNSIQLFTSKSDPTQGDLTKLGAGGVYSTTIFDGGNASRSGKRLNLPGAGSFPNRTDTTGRIIYSFTTIQPIVVVSRTVTSSINNGKLKLTYNLSLRNTSQYNVCNIRVKSNLANGEIYDQTFCFTANELKQIIYTADFPDTYPQLITDSGVNISDPNYYKESSATPYSNIFDAHNYNAKTALVFRNDLNAPSNWYAAQPSWGETDSGLLSVQIIPYSFSTPAISINLPPIISLNKLVKLNNGSEVKSIQANPGDILTYDIVIANTGANARNLLVTDLLPINAGILIDKGDASINANNISWNLPLLNTNSTIHKYLKFKLNNIFPIGKTSLVNTVSLLTVNTTFTSSASTTIDVIAQPVASYAHLPYKAFYIAKTGSNLTLPLVLSVVGSFSSTVGIVVSIRFIKSNHEIF